VHTTGVDTPIADSGVIYDPFVLIVTEQRCFLFERNATSNTNNNNNNSTSETTSSSSTAPARKRKLGNDNSTKYR
jgi:hypothetical protein